MPTCMCRSTVCACMCVGGAREGCPVFCSFTLYLSRETGPITEPRARLVASKPQEQGHTQAYMATFSIYIGSGNLCLRTYAYRVRAFAS